MKKAHIEMNPANATRQFHGCAQEMARFLLEEQLLDRRLWKRFVDQFREQIDGENQGWRGEYWGKMMRAGAMVYAYNRNEQLYDILSETVCDMLTVAEADGRVSTYSVDTEFDSWDIWCRKYVILGLIYYYNICDDERRKGEILKFLCGSLDYIVAHIGKEEGKKPITSASRSWLGINSSSLLEPVVKLYALTGKQTYLDFATYIVEEGGAAGINIFELAYENKLYPYQYGVSKAYEMMSCFEGLIEYYVVTGEEKYKIAAVNFAKAVMESDITVIGTCGCTHELFDHSRNRQTVKYTEQDGAMQETCVTVTWMKLCSRLLCLTGESIFADYIEQAFYNAYAGSMNYEHKVCDYIYQKFVVRQKAPYLNETFLPVDSYSPLTSGRRGVKVGGTQLLSDMSYYGCCTCISAAGVGTFTNHAVLVDSEGVAILFFEKSEHILSYKGKEVRILMDTRYPADGKLRICADGNDHEAFRLKIRIPGWSANTKIETANGYMVKDSYAEILVPENEGATVDVEWDMTVRATYPIHWDEDVIYTDMSNLPVGSHSASGVRVKHQPEEDDYVSLAYGPLTLAVDSRMGKDADSVFEFKQRGGALVYTVTDNKEIVPGTTCCVDLEFSDNAGNKFHLVDYASAGRDWKSNIAAWLKTK